MERDSELKWCRDTESGIAFRFFCETVKYDETQFYKKYANKLEEMKAVDFLSVSKNGGQTILYLMEVKNFDIISKEEKSERLNPEGKDPLHIEIAQKVRDSLSGLVGASSFFVKQCALELKPYYRLIQEGLPMKSRLVVVAFIEGNLSGYKKGFTTAELGLQRRIERALKWMRCDVQILNSRILEDLELNWMSAEKNMGL